MTEQALSANTVHAKKNIDVVVQEVVDDLVGQISAVNLSSDELVAQELGSPEQPGHFSHPNVDLKDSQRVKEVKDNTDIINTPETENNVGNKPIGRAAEAISDEDIFRTRAFQFRGHPVRVVMQSRNGPCPLIAAVNALALIGRVNIPFKSIVVGIEGVITRAELTDLIGGLIIIPPNIPTVPPLQNAITSQGLLLNYEKKVADVLEILPDLGFGLDVNVKFNDITAFEYTKEIDLFDLLNLRLYHTWKVEGEFVDAVGDMYYSQVAEKATSNNVLNDFLNMTQSQMTYSGLFALQETLSENSIAILFRNNHFHTVLRQNNKLYLLATDEGFLGQPAVWEILENIDGDSEFVDMNFTSLKTVNDHEVNRTPHESTSASTPGSSHSILSDFEFAKQLQQEEIDRRRAENERIQRPSHSQNTSFGYPSDGSSPAPSRKHQKEDKKKESVGFPWCPPHWFFQCSIM